MTGRVDIPCLRKLQKSKKRSHRNGKTSFLVYIQSVSVRFYEMDDIWKLLKIYFFGSCDFNFNFFAVFLNELSFMNFFVVQTSRTRFFFISWKVKYLILVFSVNLPVIFIYKRKSNSTIRRTTRTTSRWISTKNVDIENDMDSISLFIN